MSELCIKLDFFFYRPNLFVICKFTLMCCTKIIMNGNNNSAVIRKLKGINIFFKTTGCIGGNHNKACFIFSTTFSYLIKGYKVKIIHNRSCFLVTIPLVLCALYARLIHCFKNKLFSVIFKVFAKLSPYFCKYFLSLFFMSIISYKPEGIIVVNIYNNLHIKLQSPVNNLINSVKPFLVNCIIRCI